MKYLMRIFLLAVLLAALTAAGALAEGEAETVTEPGSELVLSGTLSPDELVLPGTATLSLLLHNTSDEDILDIRLFMMHPITRQVEELGQIDRIAAGATEGLEQNLQITQAQLDAGEVVVFLNLGEGDSFAATGNLGIPITKAEANIDLEFTRQLSSQYAAVGDQVTVAYVVSNCGNVELRQVVVRDELGQFAERIGTLMPGETRTVINRVSIREKTASVASVEYLPQTERYTYKKQLENVEIDIAQEGLKVDILAGTNKVYYGGQVMLTVRVTNTGNVKLTGITMTDASLGMFTDKPFSLEPGEAQEFSRMVTLFSDRQFQATATASSPTGDEVEAQSNAVDVSVEGDSAAVFFTIEARPMMERINRPGKVTFEITLINSGLGSVANVQIAENTEGVLRTFTVVPAGQPTVRYVSLPVEASRQFQFSYTVVDDEGRQSTGYADPVSVTIASDGQTPDPLTDNGEQAVLMGESTKPGTVNLYPYMIAGALILLAVLSTLLIITGHQERRARKLRKKQREEAKLREEAKKK